jgi:peptidoglycan/xylan/chitin deacetylase (PgdA/CDA1 family)
VRILFAVLLIVLLSVSSLYGADHAVVLLYHHVSTDTPASTSVSPEIFRQHLNYLDSKGFNVLPLSRVLKTFAKGGSVPDRTVCITFDDAYRSVYDQAMPMLKERNWPFTVFVNTLAIDKGYRNYLGWSDLRQLLDAGAEIGNHSHSHAHLVRRLEGESGHQWRTRVAEDIDLAQQRLKKELGVDVEMFAYPFGEHTQELQDIVGSLGYFGIAQQSGAFGHGFNRLAVPRFPMATNYADMNRFTVSVNSRPLPVTDVSSGPVVQVAGKTSQHQLAFTLLPGDYRSTGLSCYSSSGERLMLIREEGAGGNRVSVQLPDWEAGRRKINCTAPSSVENGVYYWYSHLWLVKQSDGKWYSE